jgi:hypothetical protein
MQFPSLTRVSHKAGQLSCLWPFIIRRHPSSFQVHSITSSWLHLHGLMFLAFVVSCGHHRLDDAYNTTAQIRNYRNLALRCCSIPAIAAQFTCGYHWILISSAETKQDYRCRGGGTTKPSSLLPTILCSCPNCIKYTTRESHASGGLSVPWAAHGVERPKCLGLARLSPLLSRSGPDLRSIDRRFA